MKRCSKKRTGLVLLVVLGMLALFSLLTVTYVVFASQSKSSNLALSRRYVQGGKPYRPVFEEAIKQLIRGSSDPGSELYAQSMLDDLYGANETARLTGAPGRFVARTVALTGGPMLHTWSQLERPMLLSGRFLRIPLRLGPNVPAESDVLNGRIVTFPEGEGPLSGLSFHIIRYMGDLSGSADPAEFASSYSITIDLLENDMSQVRTQVVGTGNGQTTVSGTLAFWAARFPPMTAPPLSGPWSAGCYLCYETVGLSPNSPTLSDPYEFFINAVPLNGHGVGVLADGSNQYHMLSTAGAGIDPNINVVPTGLQPRANQLGTNIQPIPFDKLIDPEFNRATPPQFTISNLPPGSTRQTLYGDTDEPLDTPDFNTMFMAFRPASAANSGDIIPSFHRTALINYLVNFKPLAAYTEPEFWAVIRRIELATMRPLSLNLRTPSGVPAFMDSRKVVNEAGIVRYLAHPVFDPNLALNDPEIDPVMPNGKRGIPTLRIDIANNWSSSWGSPAVQRIFTDWLNSLMVGKWDVDNLASGIPDSLFIDAGLPLQTTPDGKLLKAMVAYYVECLDGKLDINAAGGTAQANMFGPANLYARPTAIFPTTLTAATPFARGNLDAGASIYLNQGMGYGSADISLRHIFGKPSLQWPAIDPDNNQWNFLPNVGSDPRRPAYAELAYQNLMTQRYVGAIGTTGHDAISQLNLRETRPIHRHGALPGLPTGVRGRVSVALDRLGNPFIHNESLPIGLNNENEYEARLISAPYQDLPFTLAEWERIYRLADGDHTALPSRLQQTMGETDQSITSSSLRHEITPRSRHLTVAKLGVRSPIFKSTTNDNIPLTAGNEIAPPTSFFQLVNTIRTLKSQPVLPHFAFQSLFPIEFQRGQAFNLNRPFGNGVDDDGDGEIDEPVEVSQGQRAWDATGPTGIAASPIGLDPLMGFTGDDLNLDPAATTLSPNERFLGSESRQMFARHLYCLAQLLVPVEYSFPSIDRGYWRDLLERTRPTNGNATDRVNSVQEYLQIRSRILAQWAVNVVDYRDADSTMTRFPYDPDPFDMLDYFLRDANGNPTYTNSSAIGWEPDRILTADTTPSTTPIRPLTAPLVNPQNPDSLNMYVAWGMEQPELLLTESLAFHDLRIRRDPDANPPRYDQFRLPQGSLFLELFSPRTTETGTAAGNSTQLPGVSPALYTTNAAGDVVLDLGRLTPASLPGLPNPVRYPVWRVYVTGSIDKSGMSQAVGDRTPDERLKKPTATDVTQSSRFNLTYQSRVTNGFVNGNMDYSGMLFDWSRLPNQRIPEPDPATSRVILFTPPSPGFTPTAANTPGITSDFQIFSNRTGNLQLHGNQYLVVGPRAVTYLGSEESSRTSDGGNPGNVPSNNRIELGPSWPSLYYNATDQYRTNGQNVRPALTMVAAAARPTTWSNNPNPPTLDSIGISVSEPLPGAAYYREPTDRINSNNGSGFDTGFADGYFDFDTATTDPTPERIFDSGAVGPLANWDNNYYRDDNGDPQRLLIKSDVNGTDRVVVPGTADDWSTAYLQRLADPEKPWHAAFNPYITVDWISIDLTVFSGEERTVGSSLATNPFAPEFQSNNDNVIRLASRQKSGQMISPSDQAFVRSTPNNRGGQSLYSQLSHAPQRTRDDTSLTTFLKYELFGDDSVFATNPFALRPSNCDGNFIGYMRPQTPPSPNPPPPEMPSFTTLGFLNSPFVLAAESGTPNLPGLLQNYVGAPGDPANNNNPTWFPSSVFWANRPFINGFEMSYVPVSGPGQFGQEFCATNAGSTTQSIYQPAYHKPGMSGNPADPRMPNTIFSPQVPDESVAPNPHVTNAEWATNIMTPQWTQTSRPPAIDGTVNPDAHYPFTHLLNFFQEAPELQTSEQKYRNTTRFDRTHQFRYRHPKDTSLSLLFDLVDTPSAWGDVENHQESQMFAFQDPGSMTQEFATVAAARNRVLAPFRAPYNKLPRHVEPGRVNLNTTSEQNVLQGLWSNVSAPSDIDFHQYLPFTAFPQPNDFDHNNNGAVDVGGRTTPNSIGTVWTAFVQSRTGYQPIASPFYNPPNATTVLDPALPIRAFNPWFPTHFAGAFKPMSEAGMVPQTRNPIPNSLHGAQYGLLDFHTRLNPAHATVMRAASDVVPPGDTGGIVTGLYRPTTSTLFNDSSSTQRHPFNDLYPISRLQKLVTERSNVFAVYTTIGLFDYDPVTGNVGKEYGVDSGEARRFKAFYVVDRSVPVGFRIGEDHNIENTILVRRILAE